MLYNGLQTSVRKRFANRYSWEVNYTLSKSEGTQGGDLSAYYITSFENNQDFWDPEYDRGPAVNDVLHRVNGTFIYEVPGIRDGHGILNGILGGWQISGILQARSGGALIITQPSGIARSRPDVVPGVDLVVAEWKDACDARGCNYLNAAGFTRVPVSSVTNATLRPGTYQLDMARGPGNFNLHSTFAKNFGIGGGRTLQLRTDVFSLLNRKNYNNPELRINNADFGRITGASGSRTFQIGARLTF